MSRARESRGSLDLEAKLYKLLYEYNVGNYLTEVVKVRTQEMVRDKEETESSRGVISQTLLDRYTILKILNSAL